MNAADAKPLAVDERVERGLPPLAEARVIDLPSKRSGGGEGGGGGETIVAVLEKTDLRNGERFAQQHRGEALYIPEWGKWCVWDGRRYRLDHGSVGVVGLAKDTVRSIADPAWAKKSGARERIGAMIYLAQSEPGMAASHETLDTKHMLLNLANGTLNLESGVLHPHDPSDRLTMLSDVKYDPFAKAPRWLRFLEEVTQGDAEVQRYLQRFAGYCLTGLVVEHMLLFAYGSGRNGKGTFLRRLMGILGEYAVPARQELLMATQGEQHPTIKATLFRKRLVAVSEVDQGRRWAEADLKEMTGGDRLSARRMREDDWWFDPTHKFFVSGNHQPQIRGKDDGIWSRIKMVGFPVNFEKLGKLDRGLDAALDQEIEGILAWAVEGCADWQKHGLGEPAAVAAATKAYREDQDALADFFAECCEFGSVDDTRFRAKRSTLRTAYEAWCEREGVEPWKPRTFWQALRERPELEEAKSVKEPTSPQPERGFRGVRVLSVGERGQRKGANAEVDGSEQETLPGNEFTDEPNASSAGRKRF